MKLRPVTLYEFHTGHLHGYLRGSGHSPGIEIIRAGDKHALTPPGGSLLKPAHYLSDDAAGPEAALCAPERRQEAGEKSLQITFPPGPGWPVETTVKYSLVAEECIDAAFRFRFLEAQKCFEAHVVSAFCEGAPTAHVHAEGEWFRPALRSKEIAFFARDEASASTIESGRWDFYLERGYNVILDERGYDYPILVYLDEKSGAALVQMLMTDECPSICLGTSPTQHSFSLVGKDVAAGEEAVGHVRLLYGHFEKLDKLMPLYQKFIREVREGTFAA